MEQCACLCSLGSSRGSSRGCRCPQKHKRPSETAAAKGKGCRQECQGPAEKAAAEGKPALAEKHLKADAAARCCAGSGGIQSPMLTPHCSLQGLPPELLVEIFASLPGTDLPSLAQACTKFHHILHIDSIWRRCCREEFGVPESLPNQERRGMSYREVYAKLFHPYRHILGLWQLDTEDYRTLLNVVVDGLCITGWTCWPPLNTDVDGPMEFEPLFRIRLAEWKLALVEYYMDTFYRFSHKCHLQIQKDRFSIQWFKRDHRKDGPPYHCLTYRRLYLPPSHSDDLIRPGLFQGKYDADAGGQTIAMLSFHGKYARFTKVTGFPIATLQIHLMRRIQPPDGEIFRNFNELSRVVHEIDEQVIRKQQQQQQQQQEDGTEESEGHGWQSPAQPSVGESGAAASEEQPVPFVLPVGVRSIDQNYPEICRMCFYGVDDFAYNRRCLAVFILFDENHFGFIWLEAKQFFLFGRVQNTFQNVEAPSPKAFLEKLKDVHSNLLEKQLRNTLKI